MKLAFPRETHPGETRAAAIPASVQKLVKLGLEVSVEKGLGDAIKVPDEAYEKAGAKVQERPALYADAAAVLRLRKPNAEEAAAIPEGAIHVSFLDPFNERELVEQLARRQVSAISMEMVPRSTRAQKLDALSSQASLAGYAAVIVAAERLDQIFPMMMTPAGTISPAKVFVIGAGVAGLQAIATARRLGARVEAFDTRPVVKTEVQSLGAKFVEIDLGETGQTKDGYAKQLTEEQLQRQREGMAKICAGADVVITTAQLFGRKAPLIVTEEMVAGMKPGSVIVDLAVESGGNVAGSKLNEEVMIGGVRIVGIGNLPGRVALDASQMYASNLTSLVEEMFDADAGALALDQENEIIQGCLITTGGHVVNSRIRQHYGLEEKA